MVESEEGEEFLRAAEERNDGDLGTQNNPFKTSFSHQVLIENIRYTNLSIQSIYPSINLSFLPPFYLEHLSLSSGNHQK